MLQGFITTALIPTQQKKGKNQSALLTAWEKNYNKSVRSCAHLLVVDCKNNTEISDTTLCSNDC